MPKPQRRLPMPRAMIVAPQPEAVEAGLGVLAAGGSAVDAMLAAAFMQGVVDPLMCGVGGLGVMQVHDPASGTTAILDGMSTCPAAARPEMWLDRFERECPDGFGYVLQGHVNELGATAVTTPGILRVFARAHERFGRLPWAGLFGPAIAAATAGWTIRPHVAGVFATDEAPYGRLPYARKLAHTEDGRRLYLRADGTPRRLGERVVNPDLAATLATIASEGVETFYTGTIARHIIAAMAAEGGLMTAADLAGFRLREPAALRVSYRGRTISLPPPPAGGIVIGEMLRILERFDLVSMGHNSAEYIRVLAEAMKIAGHDREAHVGDPDAAPVPVERLLSDAHTAAAAARIRAGEKAALPRGGSDGAHTTTLSCVDASGMVASLTHTLGVPSGVIPPGTGFMLNGGMNWYDPRPGRAGSIGAGKRRFSTLSPLIVFEEDKPVATMGAPGGAWIGVALLQTLLNLLDWGMTMQEAVSAARISATSDAIDICNRVPRATEHALQAMGYTVRRSPLTFPFAAPHGIALWGGTCDGGADPQRDGLAAGLASPHGPAGG